MRKYLPDENSCNFTTANKMFTEQVEKVHISQWRFQNLLIQETHAFKLKDVYT